MNSLFGFFGMMGFMGTGLIIAVSFFILRFFVVSWRDKNGNGVIDEWE